MNFKTSRRANSRSANACKTSHRKENGKALWKIRSVTMDSFNDDQYFVRSRNKRTFRRTSRLKRSRNVKLNDAPSSGVAGDVQSITSFDIHYAEEWKADFAEDCVFWKFDMTQLLEQDLLMGFLKRLKQVQLLDFFQKTFEVIAPRDLIVNFILECKIERISSSKRVLTYELDRGKLKKLRIEVTRNSFAETLGLPEVENEEALHEYSNPKSFRSSSVEWLGMEYYGVLCKCPQMCIPSSNGFADCIQCSSQNCREVYWLLDEIKDSSIKDLIHFIGVWIHNTANTSCLRKAAIGSVLEALNSQSAKQIWTQHLWTNFLWTIEKLKEAGSHNMRCECSYSTAGVISAILSGPRRKLRSWNQAWQVWEKESCTPTTRICKAVIKRLNVSDESAAESEAEAVNCKRNLNVIFTSEDADGLQSSAPDGKVATSSQIQ